MHRAATTLNTGSNRQLESTHRVHSSRGPSSRTSASQTSKADASGAALLGEGGLLTEVTRAVLERALDAEMSEHLGCEKHDPAGRGSGNNRNGTSPKTVLTDAGAVTVAVPQDRNGSFTPRLVPKHARRLAGFNERILSLYARGMSVRDILPPGRQVRRGGFTGPHQQGHRCRRRRTGHLAEPAADVRDPSIRASLRLSSAVATPSSSRRSKRSARRRPNRPPNRRWRSCCKA